LSFSGRLEIRIYWRLAAKGWLYSDQILGKLSFTLLP